MRVKETQGGAGLREEVRLWSKSNMGSGCRVGTILPNEFLAKSQILISCIVSGVQGGKARLLLVFKSLVLCSGFVS